ncbi:hypothetical protein AVEN_33349-1 [Araneus ventricosus]|uniref:Uncharacterized protein n=1 Tax=Araneus ventricosus TaxID=182803 RepID=A0A4Y2QHJ1_ARAVE|nr:hypothetical protein AVEN_33349-1 [Araneus ventricosus]
MNKAYPRIHVGTGLIFLQYEGLIKFIGVMVISLLASLHRHCPHVLRRHLIETDHYKRNYSSLNRRIFCVLRYRRSVPRYFDQYIRLIVTSVITIISDYCTTVSSHFSGSREGR